jgi:hypothetical protein
MCTAASVEVNGRIRSLPWPPFVTDVSDMLVDGPNRVAVELCGGRKNILGPLHVPWGPCTGPEQFSPDNPQWTFEYRLNDHGLMEPPLLETTL